MEAKTKDEAKRTSLAFILVLSNDLLKLWENVNLLLGGATARLFS
jgi:hypothetical protein